MAGKRALDHGATLPQLAARGSSDCPGEPARLRRAAQASQEARARMPQRGPLSGITVIDLSRILAGPYCTMLMAEMGARVIKVEPPETRATMRANTGRSSRATRPISPRSIAARNRSRSISRAEADKRIFERLLDKADVRGREFPPGHDGKARLWLGDAACALSAPDLCRRVGLRPYRPQFARSRLRHGGAGAWAAS